MFGKFPFHCLKLNCIEDLKLKSKNIALVKKFKKISMTALFLFAKYTLCLKILNVLILFSTSF